MSDSFNTTEVGSFFGKSQSRRDFLKVTGGGLAAAFIALTLGGATKVKIKGGNEVMVWATPNGVMVQDPNRCVACRRCEYACTARNDGKVSSHISRVKITRNQNFGPKGVSSAYAVAEGQLGNFRIVGETCRQCAKPACGINCPVGAIGTNAKTGARVVDVDKCIGCGTCERACPWSIPTVDQETNISTKCTTCDGDPSCAKACPTGAIRMYSFEDAEKLLYGADVVSGATA